MLQKSLLAALCAAMLVGQMRTADAAIITATQRGSVHGGISNNGSSGANSYRVQDVAFSSSNDIGNWMTFNTSSLSNSWVTSATVRLRAFGGSSGTKTYLLRDFNGYSSSSGAMWTDIRFGSFYGSTAFGSVNSNSIISVGLNSTALAAIQDASFSSGNFSVGGTLFGGNSAFTNSGGSPSDTRLDVSAVANNGPQAISVDKLITVGDNVELDGSGSFDSDALYGDSIMSYMWDIDNDGTFEVTSGSSLNLSYADLVTKGLTPGINSIGLKVTDRWGSTNTILSNITIATVPEPTTFAILSALGCLGLAVRGRRKAACG